MRLAAASVGCVLFGLALLHLYWAVGGASGGATVPSRLDGTPTFRPGRFATATVALAPAVAAWLVLARTQLLPALVPHRWIQVGAWGVAAAFAARTIGEFRYVGLFRRVRGTPFARWDARVFTPLCATLAVAIAWIAAS